MRAESDPRYLELVADALERVLAERKAMRRVEALGPVLDEALRHAAALADLLDEGGRDTDMVRARIVALR